MTWRAPSWRPLVVGLAVLALAGCGDGDQADTDRPPGAPGLQAALAATLAAGEQNATLVVRRKNSRSEDAAEVLRLSGRFNPRLQTGEATLRVPAPPGVEVELSKLKLSWDTNEISVDGGPGVARVKAREGSGGAITAAADQMQALVDVVADARAVGETEPGVWTFEVTPAEASAEGVSRQTAAAPGAAWRGEARAGDDKGLDQISLQLPSRGADGGFTLLLLTLG